MALPATCSGISSGSAMPGTSVPRLPVLILYGYLDLHPRVSPTVRLSRRDGCRLATHPCSGPLVGALAELAAAVRLMSPVGHRRLAGCRVRWPHVLEDCHVTEACACPCRHRRPWCISVVPSAGYTYLVQGRQRGDMTRSEPESPAWPQSLLCQEQSPGAGKATGCEDNAVDRNLYYAFLFILLLARCWRMSKILDE